VRRGGQAVLERKINKRHSYGRIIRVRIELSRLGERLDPKKEKKVGATHGASGGEHVEQRLIRGPLEGGKSFSLSLTALH